MGEIKLNARLQAYTRTPLYSDYIRNVIINSDGTTTALKPGVSYIWLGDRWSEFDFGSVTELGSKLNNVENSVTENTKAIDRISVKSGTKAGTLIFIDKNGLLHEIDTLPDAIVDNTTLCINDDNEISLMHPWDSSTIKINPATGCMETVGIVINGEVVSGDTLSSNLNDKIDQARNDIALTNKNLENIAAYVTGNEAGTALPPVEFPTYNGKNTGSISNSSENIGGWLMVLDFLTNYAIQQLSETLTLSELTPQTLPNNIKVQDLITGYLWVFSRDNINDTGNAANALGEWLNNGKDLVVSATNNGIFGVVTGSEWVDNSQVAIEKDAPFKDEWETYTSYLQGHIAEEQGKIPDPIFTLNGLAERLKDLDRSKVERINNVSGDLDIVYTLSKGTDYNKNELRSSADFIAVADGTEYEKHSSKYKSTVVKRTDNGRIKAQQPQENDDVINTEWFNSLCIDDAEYNIIKAQLTSTSYDSSWINNTNDVTTVFNYSKNVNSGL